MSTTSTGKEEPAVLTTRISLNVGGEKFETEMKTLLSIPDSYLAELASAPAPSITTETKDEVRKIFIDRNPQLFVDILEYHRNGGKYYIGRIDMSMREEAKFFKLPELVKYIESQYKKCIICELSAMDFCSHPQCTPSDTKDENNLPLHYLHRGTIFSFDDALYTTLDY